ncbi:MAG TPA: class I SAM-dependent methyltransferase [Burkholderiales bacterium]|nr:class I SAM-dependent methyltransferase [Burkholderiales bacterium]
MLRQIVPVVIACLVSIAAAHAAEMSHEHGFHGAEHWAKVFDDPSRDAWQKPHEVIQALQLGPDAVVADIGAGTGYFSVRLAHMVPQGTVYAVDAEPDMVAHLKRRAQEQKLPNLRAVQAAADDPRLPEKADVILFVDVYHHIGNRVRYFSRLRDSLKPGGRLAIVDFRLDSPMGPAKSGRIPPDAVKRELAQAGYTLAAEHDFLPNQYYLVFRSGGN